VSQDVTLLEGLLPHRVRWAQAVIPVLTAASVEGDYPEAIEAGLFPEEREHIAHAVAKRRVEFAAVRRCARKALQELGYPPVPILPGEQREPRWPEGVVGSMTHCAGYCAAAVARSGEVSALGIDAEVHAPLPEGVLDLISLESERALLAELTGRVPGAVHWDRVLFSAKESVYKAWFPLTRRWLGFEQADIELRMDGTFEARLLNTEAPATQPPASGAASTAASAASLKPKSNTPSYAASTAIAASQSQSQSSPSSQSTSPSPSLSSASAAGSSPTSGIPRGFAGRWAVSGGLIATAVGEVVG
jgi:4'-phosphopantetheinyl transferase EntD